MSAFRVRCLCSYFFPGLCALGISGSFSCSCKCKAAPGPFTEGSVTNCNASKTQKAVRKKKLPDRQTGKQAGRQTGRQTDRQTDGHTHTHTHTHTQARVRAHSSQCKQGVAQDEMKVRLLATPKRKGDIVCVSATQSFSQIRFQECMGHCLLSHA